jgi:hypothetical protein
MKKIKLLPFLISFTMLLTTGCTKSQESEFSITNEQLLTGIINSANSGNVTNCHIETNTSLDIDVITEDGNTLKLPLNLTINADNYNKSSHGFIKGDGSIDLSVNVDSLMSSFEEAFNESSDNIETSIEDNTEDTFNEENVLSSDSETIIDTVNSEDSSVESPLELPTDQDTLENEEDTEISEDDLDDDLILSSIDIEGSLDIDLEYYYAAKEDNPNEESNMIYYKGKIAINYLNTTHNILDENQWYFMEYDADDFNDSISLSAVTGESISTEDLVKDIEKYFNSEFLQSTAAKGENNNGYTINVNLLEILNMEEILAEIEENNLGQEINENLLGNEESVEELTDSDNISFIICTDNQYRLTKLSLDNTKAKNPDISFAFDFTISDFDKFTISDVRIPYTLLEESIIFDYSTIE